MGFYRFCAVNAFGFIYLIDKLICVEICIGIPIDFAFTLMGLTHIVCSTINSTFTHSQQIIRIKYSTWRFSIQLPIKYNSPNKLFGNNCLATGAHFIPFRSKTHKLEPRFALSLNNRCEYPAVVSWIKQFLWSLGHRGFAKYRLRVSRERFGIKHKREISRVCI